MNTLARLLMDQDISRQPQSILDWLLDDVAEVRTDQSRWSYQGIADRLGIEAAAIVLMLLEQAASSESDEAMRAILKAELLSFQIGSQDGRTGGIDLSRPERQAKLAEWEAALRASERLAEADILKSVAALGVQRIVKPRWEVLGLERQPDLDEVSAALQQVAVYRWSEQALRRIAELRDSGESTIEQIKQAITELD